MSSNALPEYRHSGKFTTFGVFTPLVAAVLLGWPLGLAYGHASRWIPFVIFNMLLPIGYGFAFGAVTLFLLKKGRVRNVVVAALIGLLVGSTALYFSWNGSLHALVPDAPLVFFPDEIAGGILYLYEQGSWSIGRGPYATNVAGLPLALVWLGEAGIIYCLTIAVSVRFVRDTPYCEDSRCWFDEAKAVNCLAAIDDPDQVAQLRAGDITPLTLTQYKAGDADNFTRLLVTRSKACDYFCTLQVQDVQLSLNRQGHVVTKTRNLTKVLMISASMFDQIAAMELNAASVSRT
jgi:hypothetical protein